MLLLTAMSTAASAETPAYKVDMSGVTYLGVKQSGTITVNVSGGPGGSFKYSADLSGKDVTDASIKPSNGDSNGTFVLNITAPSTAQDIVLTVNISSSNTSAPMTAKAKWGIKVVEPIAIKATVFNVGNMTASNVPIQVRIDGKLVSSMNLTINGMSNKTLTYNWTEPNIAAGAHVVNVSIDPNYGFILFPNGRNSFETTIYVGDSGIGLLNIFLAVVLGVLLFFAFISYMNRGKKKRRK